MERITLAALHLLALGFGFGAIMARWITLRHPLDLGAVKRVLHFDNQWAIAAGLWIVTGLWRWLGSVEKASSYYNGNHLFLAKLGCLTLILLLEVWPMVTLIRWRIALGRGAGVDSLPNIGAARGISSISAVQALLVATMVFLAAAMARGYGVIGR